MRPLALALLVLALPAAAQPSPVVANAPLPGADFLRVGGDPVPDTTAPWRYFPLHVGDAWEYYHYQTGERRRVDVLGEETHNGRHYFTWRSRTYDADGNNAATWGPRPVRFDTTSAMGRVYVTEFGEESRFPLPWTPCPLDASFNSEIACPEREELPYEVGGGYDGLLAFGGEFPGTGEDTVRTAVKTYYSFHPGHTLDYRYAADIGFVYYDDKYDREGIYYAKVDGVEYGQPFYPVSLEGGAPETGSLALAAYPNPSRGRLTVSVALSSSTTAADLAVYDTVGRLVQRTTLGPLGPGKHIVTLDVSRLPSGVYFVRSGTGDERTARPFIVTS